MQIYTFLRFLQEFWRKSIRYLIILSHFVLNIDLFRRIFLIVIHYTYMLDIIKIRFKIPFYSRITAKNKAQLRDCFVMHLFLKSDFPSDS